MNEAILRLLRIVQKLATIKRHEILYNIRNHIPYWKMVKWHFPERFKYKLRILMRWFGILNPPWITVLTKMIYEIN